jgi:hypothetical protein
MTLFLEGFTMMPQPLSKVVPGQIRITMPLDAPLKQPELSVLVAQALSIWSLVEKSIGQALVNMLGGKAGPAIAMYGALTSSVAQAAAFKAAARHSLNQEHLGLFEALMKIYGRFIRQRHKFAHWIWALCDQAPHLLVLIDPTRLIEGHTARSEMLHRQATLATTKFRWALSDEWYGYSKKDLEKIVQNFADAYVLFDEFERLLSPIEAVPKAQIFDFLCRQPLVATELIRLREGQKTSPLEPPLLPEEWRLATS